MVNKMTMLTVFSVFISVVPSPLYEGIHFECFCVSPELERQRERARAAAGDSPDCHDNQSLALVVVAIRGVPSSFTRALSLAVFETAYLLTTLTNYDVKLSKREISKRV